ncbi:biopolymer transporter ExbD [Myxococcota bacterium]|nr:biopolymer transporter ExbD [Myxococcota bacterium]MBP8970678.1 biopolymer transporter ExbD [Myxococcota bacterium]OQC43158.1 MAG: Biopolymer transport protein ExbD [Deltaproteobacteria bacterium ADurb.Bin058]HQL57118.1 biopolymer transporter ExbD [Myxococcota bacterium]
MGLEKRRMITEINVTPMVDVMLVLLIIFMVTATYITRKGFEVQLPEGSTGDELAESSLAFRVSSDGQFMLNDEIMDIDQIKARIPAILEENPSAMAVIDADRTVEYGQVMGLIDTLRGLGVKNFAAALEHLPDEAQ